MKGEELSAVPLPFTQPSEPYRRSERLQPRSGATNATKQSGVKSLSEYGLDASKTGSRRRVPNGACTLSYTTEGEAHATRIAMFIHRQREPTVRGKSKVSLIFCTPVMYIIALSKPRPKPLCGTLPYLRVSRYSV